MHVILNRLPLSPDVDWSALTAKVDEFNALGAMSSDAFKGVSLLRTAPDEGVLLVMFTNGDELTRVSRDVAAPWFAVNIRHLLSGPVERRVGEVVAGHLAGG